ncbi:MAG: acyl-CoA dehydratase activase, partial [Candidatus Margulisiibacteriota bacterium]
MKYYLGIDIGSISVNTVLINEQREIIEEHYLRSKGAPAQTAQVIIKTIAARYQIAATATTGSGGKLIPGYFVNEIVAQSAASAFLHPEVSTVIEIGGEDAKLLHLKTGKLTDFATNTVCAAGTGSFLDQQASRLGLSIEDFAKLALKSKHPPRIAGRCTVFAKSDMIHLQQKGTPDYEIVAGLCLAVARNFVSNVGKGKKWLKPIAFQGGVAANAGMVKAFELVLGLESGELLIPKHFASMGAIGAV